MPENIKITVVTPTIRPDGLSVVAESLKKQTLKDFEWLVEINVSGQVDFNRAMNKMLRRAKGELIVSVQDYIKIPEDGLEKLWAAYLEEPTMFWTCPVGKTTDWKNVAYDWREHVNTTDWQGWEIDFGAAPLAALQDIGGFDEALDEYWGFDNCLVAKRAEIKGYSFGCLPGNKAIAYDHNATQEHPFMKLRNVEAYNYLLRKAEMGESVDYLK